MNGEEIIRIASSHFHTRDRFGGVYAANLIPPLKFNSNSFYILNTDYIQGKGEHWVMVNTFSGDGMIEWFDPLGSLPSLYNKELFNFVSNFGKKHYLANTTPVQSPLSNKCGYFCLMMVDLRILGYSLEEGIEFFNVEDLLQNDHLVQEYVNTHMRAI